jgi:hypothetical protein
VCCDVSTDHSLQKYAYSWIIHSCPEDVQQDIVDRCNNRYQTDALI